MSEASRQEAPILEVQNLVKDYKSVRAVDNLSFTVRPGRVTGLIGPNGAGKTTTFSIISRFLKATQGRILLHNTPLDRGSKLLGRIQVLPQDAQLPSHIPLLRQLTYYGHLQGMSRSQARDEAERVLKQVGLEEKLMERAGALSHGMHQRAAMAQAFLGKPELILLDEPTSGLDPRRASEARDLITTMKGATSILISSHNLSEIQSICDDVVIINKGKLVYQGTMEDITGQSLHFTVFVRAKNSLNIHEVSSLDGVHEATWEQEDSALHVTCKEGADDGEVVSRVLKHILHQGHLVFDLKRGASLEDKFLNLTDNETEAA